MRQRSYCRGGITVTQVIIIYCLKTEMHSTEMKARWISMAENESQQFHVTDEMLSLVPEAAARKNVQYIFTSDVLESGSGFFWKSISGASTVTPCQWFKLCENVFHFPSRKQDISFQTSEASA